MEIIPASFYTELSHSVKRQNDLKCMEKTRTFREKNAKFSEEKQLKCFLICFRIAKATFSR